MRKTFTAVLFLLGAVSSAEALPPPYSAPLDLSVYTKLLSAVSPVAPTYGTSVGGETTLTAPASVPSTTPWWVRVTVNGVIQRPGADFTTNGSTVIALTSPLDPNTDWVVEQLQRTPS